MALVTCPECGKQVSEAAITCPACGYPVREAAAFAAVRAWRRRILLYGMAACIIAIPIGLAIHRPAVAVLAAIGVVIASVKLSFIKKEEDSNSR